MLEKPGIRADADACSLTGQEHQRRLSVSTRLGPTVAGQIPVNVATLDARRRL